MNGGATTIHHKMPTTHLLWPLEFKHQCKNQQSSLRVIPPELLFHYFQHSKKNLGNSVKASQRATYPGNENKWTDIRLHPTTAQHTVVSFSRINLWYTAENSHWACCHFCNRHSWRRLSSQFIPLAQWQPAATVAPWGHVIHTPMSHVHTFLC